MSVEATARKNEILQRCIDAAFSLSVCHAVGIGFQKIDDVVAIHGRTLRA